MPTLSLDGRVIVLLCTRLAWAWKEQALEQFALQDWNELARRIYYSDLQRPAGLLGKESQTLVQALNVEADVVERILRLLDRQAALDTELERLHESGIWVLTRADPGYPQHLRRSLGAQRPTVFFGAGEPALLNTPGVAIVGSRKLDEAGFAFAEALAARCAAEGLTVVSGGAQGADYVAMHKAIAAGGFAVSVRADSLQGTIRQSKYRPSVEQGTLTLLAQLGPNIPFSVGIAMSRNKVIYGLAQYGLVVSSDYASGGTWAGAVENMRNGFTPLFVRSGAHVPEGNQALLMLEETYPAHPFPESLDFDGLSLCDWLAEQGKRIYHQEAEVARKAQRRSLRTVREAQPEYGF